MSQGFGFAVAAELRKIIILVTYFPSDSCSQMTRQKPKLRLIGGE